MSIASKAMIVTLNVSCWTARKQDKRVAEEVDVAHGARDAGRYNKLLIDKVHLDPLTSYAGALRSYHYKMTKPWMDNGGRLLPSRLFFSEYDPEIQKMKSHYAKLVDDFVRLYDSQLVNDARVRLGTLYDPADYPPGWELRDKFGVEIDILPFPDAQDFRVDCSQAEAERIRNEITQRIQQRQQAAMQDTWRQVREIVGNIAARCSAEKPIIRDSLIDNAAELVRLLPSFNLTEDPAITAIASDITDNLLVDVWTLRNSKSARTKVAQAANQILLKIPA